MRMLPSAWMIVLASALAAPAADDAPQGDLGKLQGKWTAMAGPNKDVPLTLEIKGNQATAIFTTPEGEKRTLKGEIRLDEKAKPKTLDWVKFKTSDGDELPDNLAIYELDGDSFKVCNGGRDNPRPTEFKESGEAGFSLLTFKRQKD
jgi:uncharacterized protein (TIGR03067 family)